MPSTAWRRTTIAVAAAAVPLAAAALPGQANPGPSPDAVRQLSRGLQIAPKAVAGGDVSTARPQGVNPYTGMVLDPSKVDFAGWRAWLEAQGAARAASPQRRAARQAAARRAAPVTAATQPLLVDELEAPGVRGYNDTPATAQLLRGFGTGAGENPRARILGRLSPESVSPTTIPATAEDDGSIPLAGATGVGSVRAAATWTATIGDGPHGSTGDRSGDFDVRRLDAKVGQAIRISTDGSLDSVVALYSAAGGVLGVDDDSGPGLSSLLTVTAPATGTYYALVAGYRSPVASALPATPFDSGSGHGVGDEDDYSATVSASYDDKDWYAVDLEPGDVIGSTGKDAATVMSVLDPGLVERMTSDQEFSYIYPAETPLPGGGNFTVEYVAKQAGRHYLGLPGGDGSYDLTVEAYRAGTPATNRVTQTLFLDYDGARVNTAIFGGPGVRQLSPLEAFLGGWGLGADDLAPLEDAITASFRENVRRDLVASGLNSRLSVRILDSRHAADPFGRPGVTRLVVGGTIDESGIGTIGIAQSIDPGNFARAETALVLLDLLSEPGDGPDSLNSFITDQTTDKLGFIGRAIGNIAAHEAGHLLGSFHTDQYDARPNLMDQGGNLGNTVGVGPDGVGGTADDVDVDFGQDVFVPTEGLTGLEDTLAISAFGLTR